MSKEFDVMFAANLIGSGGGGKTPTLIEKDITANGTYIASSDNADGYSKVIANVPNTYTVDDEGKVVDNGTLVSQTSTNITSNGTVNTTLNNEVVINVPNSYTAGDEGKVVDNGELVAQTAYPTEITANDTYGLINSDKYICTDTSGTYANSFTGIVMQEHDPTASDYIYSDANLEAHNFLVGQVIT
jgi:hypothetical protein